MVMVDVREFDAAWNSMRREAVPLLLPYKTEEDSNSWWSSQAIFWNRLACFAPLYAVTPLFIFFENPEHNKYPRNARNYEKEQQIGAQMMGGLSSILPRAPTEYEGQYVKDKIRPLPRLPLMDWPFGKTFRSCANEFYKIK
jgi:hypothetical protein